jgi:glycosyltransferase involved in cell wall biosynthesis
MNVTVTVAICTWNRAHVLAGALQSLARATVPAGVDWTTLVIDNGSTDGTAAVARSFARELPVVHVVEARPGLSHARNRALREVGGGYLLWIDDDVIVDTGWLTAYVDAFRAWPRSAVFGGPVRPLLEGTPPAWLVHCLPRVAHAFAARDLGDATRLLGPSIDLLPYGCNFAVRVPDVGGRRFREDLGRRQDGLGRGGEEIDFIVGLLGEGRDGRWVPGASVQHRIGPERQTRAYLRAYAVADAIDDELNQDRRARLPSRVELAARWMVAEARYRMARLIGGPNEWVGDLLAAGDAWGRLRARSRVDRPR